MTKEEAAKEIRKRHCTENKFCHDECMYSENACPYDMAIEALKEPEQKKGQWEEIRNAYGEIEGWTCTCGREVKCKYNYCPNCGADMRGEHG